MSFSPPTVLSETTLNGSNWNPIAGDLPAVGINDVAVDPANFDVLYIATTQGVYKSTNHGVNWTRWVMSLPGQGSQKVARLRTIDTRPSGGQLTVYAGIWGSGAWQRNGAEQSPTWQAINGQETAIGSGWSIGTNSVGNGDFGIYQWIPSAQLWSGANGGGGKKVSVDLNGNPWVVNSAGDVYKWTGSVWAGYGHGQVPANTPFNSVASGSADSETWATGTDNTIWHYAGSSWTQVTGIGAGIKIAVFSTPDATCADHLPVILGTDNRMYFVGHSGCGAYAPNGNLWPSSGGGIDISTDYILGGDTNVYHWDPTASVWRFYIASADGPDSSAQIGAGINGLFFAGGNGNLWTIVQ